MSTCGRGYNHADPSELSTEEMRREFCDEAIRASRRASRRRGDEDRLMYALIGLPRRRQRSGVLVEESGA